MKVQWSSETPPDVVAQAPVITGISAPKAKSVEPEFQWTAEQLADGKPKMVYWYIPDNTKLMEDNYTFSHKLEFSGFSNNNVELLNKNWIAIKSEIAVDADHKVEKN